ncbi:MAG: cell wall hydrolase [Acetatifactor sp.]
MKRCFLYIRIGMVCTLGVGLLSLVLHLNVSGTEAETARILTMSSLYCGTKDICLITMDEVMKIDVVSTGSIGRDDLAMGLMDYEEPETPVPPLKPETMLWDVEEKELDILRRIVEAEAGGEDLEGKMLVANVVLNRVKEDDFPDTIAEVVYQNRNGIYQFSPVRSGRIDRVEVSEETVEAVENVLRGEDLSEGALYFVARKHAKQSSLKWFEEELEFLFCHGGHEFYK